MSAGPYGITSHAMRLKDGSEKIQWSVIAPNGEVQACFIGGYAGRYVTNKYSEKTSNCACFTYMTLEAAQRKAEELARMERNQEQ